MNATAFLLAFVVGLLLAETLLSRRHEALLIARGAQRPLGDVYRALAILYPVSFLIMGIEGVWRDATAVAQTAPPGAPSFVLSGIVLFLASKWLKYWAIATLGERWTFRVYVLPGVPLIQTGPYRYIAHPNYVAVIGELVGAAMMMRAWLSGPLMVAAFGAALWARIRFEERVHRELAHAESGEPARTESEKMGN